MPTFQVQHDGKTYEVQADSAEHAAAAFDAPDPKATKGPQWPTTSPWYTTPGSPEAGQPIPKGDGLGLRGAGERLAEPITRAAEGFAQLMESGASYLPGGNPQSAADLTKATDARRAAYEKRQGPGSGTQADIASGLLPVGAASAEANASTSFFKALMRRTATGGAISAAQYVPEGGSRTQNALFGAAGAAALHTVAAAVPAVKNVVTRAITKAEANPRTAATVAGASNFFKGSNAVENPAPYSLGQQSGDPVVTRLEQRAFGPQQQELGARQADEAAARFGELADRAATVSKLDASAPGVAGAVNSTLRNTVLGMRSERSQGFKAGMSTVLAMAGPGGGPGLVPLTNLSNEYAAIIVEDANAFNINGQILPKGVERAAEEVQKATSAGAKIKIPTIQYILQGLSQDQPHGAGIFMSTADARVEMYRSRLKAALEKDLDSAGVNATSSPAFAALQKTRKTYAQQSDALRKVEDGSLNQLFGNPQALATPQAALDKFYGLRSADQQTAVDLLSKNHPEALDAMRAHRIRTALTDAQTAGAAKNSAFDIQKFNDDMFGGDKANSPLWGNDANSQQIRAGAAHLRVLLNAPQGGGGSLIAPEDISINLVSRTAAFVARIVTRAAYGKYGDQLLGTPEGLAALRTLSNTSSRKGAAFNQALAYVQGLAQQPQAQQQSAAAQ